jgi:5-methylcytosine-specific restriction protein A
MAVTRFCAKCRKVHGVHEDCPRRVPFQSRNKHSGRGGRPWSRKRERVFKRDGYLCQICFAKNILTSVELHGENAGICDHIIPKAEDGTDDERNLQTICKACDKEKTQQESLRGRGVLKS